MATKGYKDNEQQAFTPTPTDWLGIQQGNLLSDMKKITYKDLTDPLQGQIDDHEQRVDDLELAEGSIKGVGWTGASLQSLDENKADKATTYTKTEVDVTIDALDTRLDTLEGEGEGSVAKAIADAVSPLAEKVDTNRLYSDSQYLALKAKADSLQGKCNTLQAEVYTDDPILQYGATEIIGKGYEADDTPIDVSANVVDGSLALEQKGLTITNLVPNGITFTDWQSVTSVSDGWARKTSTAGVIGSIATPSALPITIVEGHKYAVRVKVRINDGFDNASLKYIISRMGGNSSDYNFANFIQTTSTSYADTTILEFTVIVTATSAHASGNGVLYLLAYNESNAIDIEWSKPLIVDLTALGLDHITDTDILAKLLPYVDGTRAVGKMGVRVVGENLSNIIINNRSINTDGKMLALANNSYALIFARVAAGMVVSASASSLGGGYVYGFYDDDIITVSSVTYNSSRELPAHYNNITIPNDPSIKWIGIRVAYQPIWYQINLGSTALPYEPYQEQLTFLPAIGNSLPNGTADSIKTVADGWEHTKRVEEVTSAMIPVYSQDAWATTGGWLSTGGTLSTFESTLRNTAPVGGGDVITRREITGCNGKLFILRVRRSSDGGLIIRANSNTTLLGIFSLTANVWSTIAVVFPSPLSTNSHYFIANELESSGTFDIDWIWIGGTAYASDTGTAQDLGSTFSAINAIAQLSTPITTHYDLPIPTSGKTIHRFAGEEKIALYGTGLTFSENVLAVLSAVKFVAGVMTDITSLATITGATVTFSGVSATDVVFAQVEHDVDKPLGVLEHTPAVSNTVSRLAAIEAWIAAQGA